MSEPLKVDAFVPTDNIPSFQEKAQTTGSGVFTG